MGVGNYGSQLGGLVVMLGVLGYPRARRRVTRGNAKRSGRRPSSFLALK